MSLRAALTGGVLAAIIPGSIPSRCSATFSRHAQRLRNVRCRPDRSEEVVNAEGGSLVDCNDGKGLLHTMSEFLTRNIDPQAIRSDVRRKFGCDAIADSLCSLYESVVARRREVG